MNSTGVAIAATGLTKYFGDVCAVDGLSVSVREGEVFGLLGPNGAGKTTSISMICGLIRPDVGQVFIRGSEIRGGDARLRSRIGVCPQGIVTWGMLTCREQLEFMGDMYGLPRRVTRARTDELLATMQLMEKRDKLARTLSGGMQRRLNLILALVHDPDIVVLDEPEAGLDPQSRVLVREYIKAMSRRKTIILTTHNMDEADRVCDRVAIIDHGRLLALDTPDGLKRQMGGGQGREISLEDVFIALTGRGLRE